jgi:MFS family permease
MSSDFPYFDADDDERPRRWARRFVTIVILVAAVIVFELSANASLGVATACLKFALDDTRDAIWLVRHDPRRGRAWACFSIYIAVGLLRAGLTGFIGAVAMAILAANFAQAWGWPDHLIKAQLLGALGVGLFGLITSTLASLLACVLAWTSKTRLWVGHEVRRAREHDHWPPQIAMKASSNRADATLIIANIGFMLIIFLIGMMLTVIIAQHIPNDHGPIYMVTIMFCGFLIIIGPAICGLALRDLLKSSIIAHGIWDCWPESIQTLPSQL